MPRRKPVKTVPSDSSDDEPLSKKAQKKSKEAPKTNDSSSESDIENYLQPADKIDLDSPFFNLQKESVSFDQIENDIFAGVSRLTDSDESEKEAIPSTSKLNFRQLHEYTRKLEEAKKHVEEYNARKKAEQKQENVSNLLAAGESKLNGDDQICPSFDSASDSDFEEVSEQQKSENAAPREGLQITVEMPGAIKKKKGAVDVFAAIKRRLNRVRKENQVLIHKVHLLCWIAHGNYVSSAINSRDVLAVALSLLPSQQCYPADRTDLGYLEQVLKWYKSAVANVEKPAPSGESLEELLQLQITKKEAFDKKMLVYIFIAILRSLGIQCRLVLSFQVEPVRPPSSELCSLSTKSNTQPGTSKPKAESDEKNKLKAGSKSSSTKLKSEDAKARSKSSSTATKLKGEDAKARSKSSSTATKLKSEEEASGSKVKASKSKGEENKTTSKSMRSKSSNEEQAAQNGASKLEKSKTNRTDPKARKLRSRNIPQVDGANDSSEDEFLPQLDGANDPGTGKPNLKKLNQKQSSCSVKDHPKRLRPKPVKYKDSSEEESDDAFSPKKNGVNLKRLKVAKPKGVDVRSDIVKIMKSRIREQREIDRSKRVRAKRKVGAQNDDDDEYFPEEPKKPRDDALAPKIKVKRRVGERIEEAAAKKKGVDVWAEVYLETEEKWISVDVIKGQVHCVSELFNRATHPVSYVVAWNNNNSLKDVTSRYCKNFNTVTRKLRIDSKWWEVTLKPFLGKKGVRDKEEDEELEKQQLDKPLPTSIAEFKNHPLYALKRHLLKFEAFYPPDLPPLGYCRNEPVYSRQCVYTLHSREIWLKHAKVVKAGEKPYKIVKARPKWDKLSSKMITDLELEIFGPWQTQDYEPPTAENGVVPRNAFGNVELFKPTMLPKKTVHLQLPGLNKVAKKLNIDCAAAVTGFDFHGGWNHPVYDGFVVCEEFKDVLIKAWEDEQEELARKEREKIEKRVYGNWKRLIRGLRIRERLKIKYEFGESSGSKKKGKNVPKTANKKRRIDSDTE